RLNTRGAGVRLGSGRAGYRHRLARSSDGDGRRLIRQYFRLPRIAVTEPELHSITPRIRRWLESEREAISCCRARRSGHNHNAAAGNVHVCNLLNRSVEVHTVKVALAL